MIDYRVIGFLLSRKTMEMLGVLYKEDGKVYASKLAKLTDTTYSHVVRSLKKLQKLNLIKTVPIGRINMIKLTEKGKKIAEICHRLLTEIKNL